MSPFATATSGLANSAAMTKSSLVLYSLVIAAQPGPWESPVWQTQSKPTFPAHAWNMEDGAVHSIAGAPGVDSNWLDTSNFAKRYLGNKGDVVGQHFP